LRLKKNRGLKVFFKKNLKTPKAQFSFFLLCDLMSKPRIQILSLICEIRQFHRHFSHAFFFLAHWTFVFGKIRFY